MVIFKSWLTQWFIIDVMINFEWWTVSPLYDADVGSNNQWIPMMANLVTVDLWRPGRVPAAQPHPGPRTTVALLFTNPRSTSTALIASLWREKFQTVLPAYACLVLDAVWILFAVLLRFCVRTGHCYVLVLVNHDFLWRSSTIKVWQFKLAMKAYNQPAFFLLPTWYFNIAIHQKNACLQWICLCGLIAKTTPPKKQRISDEMLLNQKQ